MKNFLIAFLVFLVWSFFGLWLYSWLQPTDAVLQKNDSIATNNVSESKLDINDPIKMEGTSDELISEIDTLILENEEEPVVENTVSLGTKATTPDGTIIFAYNEGITIWQNTNQIEYPTAVQDFKFKLNTYLIEHPNMELHIASLYSASENIENPNFGYQRGIKMKDILAKVGIPSEKMVIKSVIREIEFENDRRYNNGIYFTFHPLDLERVASLKLSLPETKTIYPKLVDDNIIVDETLQELLVEIKNAMANNPNLKVNVIGHTDNIGNANDNYALGLKYARQVRWYLVTKGNLDRTKVVASSAGESLSIATNRNERGRLLNRRIEIKYEIN